MPSAGGSAGYAVGLIACRSGGAEGSSGGGGDTAHWAERMEGRGITEADKARIKTGARMTQADGATVYVKGAGGGKYDYLILDEHGGVITGYKGTTGEQLRNLAEKYGWH